MKKIVIILFMIATIGACVDPVIVENDSFSEVLIVEGHITSEEGPHKIRLTKSAKYGDIFQGEIKGEIGANMYVRDSYGNTVKLAEDSLGYYSTPTEFFGVVGREYTLFIKTKDGQEYQSYPELLAAVPQIEKLYYEFKEIPNESNIPTSGVEIYSTYKDDAEADNYYKWSIQGTHYFKSNPELYMPPRSPVAVPKECCAECYLNEKINIISISKDRLYNGNLRQQELLFLQDDGSRFSKKYIAQIAQYSLSRNAYEFFELLENQLSIQGNIFDPPPAEIRGNMINLTNPETRVLGYFYASDVSRDTLHIEGVKLPYIKEQPVIPDDCREVKGATTTIPMFW